LREQAERILEAEYPFMDSSAFRRKNIERELFDQGAEPELPPTAWYQPTAQDLDNSLPNSPKLMKADEERMMFLRFNYSKKRLGDLKKKVAREGLTREFAERLVHWHRRFEHFREYLVRTNLALVLAMAKRTRLGQVDFAGGRRQALRRERPQQMRLAVEQRQGGVRFFQNAPTPTRRRFGFGMPGGRPRGLPELPFANRPRPSLTREAKNDQG
jgi:hypothetical protein